MTDLKIFINCKNPNCIYSAQPIPFSDTGLIEECPLCHSSVAIRYLPKAHKHWLAELYEDPSYWIENIEYDYPSLIAYEYNNLRTLCNDCQPYGVLLSLKDNFETLLKLEILLACSWASANTNETILQNTIVQLMTPNLSLGLWLLIASNILRELEASGYELPKTIPLKTITKQYYKNQIVNWRNTKIGHGAMELAEDENFIADIKERIQFLKNLLTNIDTALRDQEIYYYDDESSERIGNCNIISLTGFQRARMLDREGKVYFRERTTNNGFCVDPFIVIRKHENNGYGVYFFDNQRTINQTHFLAYADGSRKREYVPYFENLRRQLEVGSLNLQAKTDDIFLSEEEIRQLDIPHMSHDYIRPTHIIRWLKRCLESYDKGVFLLKMPRGTGKSVFSEKINRLFNNPETICEDIDVRTYHFSRSQSVGIDDIRYAIEWQWKNEYGKHSWERGKSISDYEKEGYSPSQALCMFLEDVRRYSERTRGRHRIMMVFDGLDEIADTKLWSFIPEDRYINTGIYFLLTSRNTDEEDIPDEIKHRIETIHVQEKHAVDCVSEEHRSFLKDYYRKTQLNKYPDDLFDKIATLSDYRTVYFGMLCKLTENGMNPEYLPDNEKIVEHYLNILRKCYGEKGFAQVKEIIITLCTLGSLEPIGINTLSAIIGENKISLQLIGIIRDVSPILKIERGDKGNRYSIANPDLATQLANQIIEKIEIVRELIQLIISLMKDKKLDEEPGLQVLSYNIVDLAIRWLPEKVQYLTSDTDDLLSDYISNRIQAAYELKDRIEILRHVKQLFNYRKLSLGHEHMMTLSCQAELARLTAELGNYEEALQLYKEVISICQKGNAFDFLTLYNNMANVLCASGRYNEAESLIREVLIISKIMLGETHPTTLSMQSNLAAVLGYMGDYDDALKLKLEDYRKTKEVYGEEHPNTFSALNNLAFTFKDLGRYQDALEMFQKAYIGAKECLGSTHPDTISCLGNLGDTYTALGLYQKAFTIKKHVYEERKKMFGDEHVSTLTIKLELADALESIEQFEDALQEYTGVYEVLRKIYGDENEHVLFVREKIARVLARLGKYESGLKIYEDIYKKCKSSSGEYSHASVRVQKNIGVLMYQCGFLEQGIKQLNSIP